MGGGELLNAAVMGRDIRCWQGLCIFNKGAPHGLLFTTTVQSTHHKYQIKYISYKIKNMKIKLIKYFKVFIGIFSNTFNLEE